MATLVVPKYIPSPEQIEAAKEEIHAARLAKWEAEHAEAPFAPDEYEAYRERERARLRTYRRRKAVEAANAELQRVDEVEEANQQAALLDAEAEQWRLQAATDHRNRRAYVIWQLKLARSHRAARKAAKLRGTLNEHNTPSKARVAVPEDGPREMSKEDICNVDLGSLTTLNAVPKKKRGPRYTLPELAEEQAPAPFKTQRDVVAFRSKRR
jgi:hypothetical protein